MNGCIVLTAKEPEPELLASLRVVKLSARKQKQVREFIGVSGGQPKRRVNWAEKMNYCPD
jgi:toxic protein SymE